MNKTITLDWQAPTQRIDNSPAAASEIDSFNIYWDQGAGGSMFLLMNRAGALPDEIVMTNVTPGTYKFQISAVDTSGQESDRSPIITEVIPALPPKLKAPTNFVGAIS